MHNVNNNNNKNDDNTQRNDIDTAPSSAGLILSSIGATLVAVWLMLTVAADSPLVAINQHSNNNYAIQLQPYKIGVLVAGITLLLLGFFLPFVVQRRQ